MSKILRSTVTISGWTAVSRILGFIRDLMFSWFFGSSFATDAFFVASTVVSSFRKLSSEGSVYNVFLPRYKIILKQTSQFFSKDKTKKKPNLLEDEMAEFITDVVKLLTISMIIILIISEVFMPYLIFAFAPGFFFKPDTQVSLEAIYFSRILFPYLFLISLVSIFSAILNANNRFWVFAFVPIIYNVTFITTISILLILQEVKLEYICVSIVISGIFQLLFTLYYINKYRLLPRKVNFFSLSLPNIKNKSLLAFLSKFPQSLIYSILLQVSVALTNIFGSFLYEGAITYLYYANRLVFLPIGLITVSIYNVLLTKLTKVRSSVRDSLIKNSLKLVDFLAFPSCLGLMLMSEELTSLFFGHGNFSQSDIINTKNVLIVLAPIIILSNYIKILQANFYSITNTRSPMYGMVWSLPIFIIFSLALIGSYGHVGIGLSVFFSTFFEAIYLLLLTGKQTRKIFVISIIENIFKFAPSLLMITVIILISKMEIISNLLPRAIISILTILLTVIVYLSMNYKTIKQLRSV